MLKPHFTLALTVLILCLLPVGWAQDSEDLGLIGHWTFDEGAGTTAVDASGNGFDGTYMDVEWGTGVDGVGSSLAGGYVQVPAESWASIDAEVSVACWVFGDPEILLEKNAVLCYASDDPGGSGGDLFDPRFMINKIRYTTGETIDNPKGWDRTQIKNIPADIFAGQWRHWVFTKNAYSGEQNVYLDGELYDAGGGLRLLEEVQYFTISHPQNPFVGRIDDFRLYNRALSLEDIKALIPAQLTASDPVPEDGSIDVDAFVNMLSWSSGETAAQHKVYLGTDPNLGPEQLYETTSETMVTYKEAYFDFGITYYWRVDEIEADGTTIHEGPLWRFTPGDIKATNPNPMDMSDAVKQPTLRWKPSVYAFEHTLYVSEDREAVAAGSAAARVGIFPEDTTDFSLGVDVPANELPSVLDQSETYYWRVDQRDNVELVIGDVWSFTVINDVNDLVDPHLIGWWAMDAEFGRLVVDTSGYGRHGQIEGDGFAWDRGIDANALTLNAGSVVVDANAVAYPNPVSMTAWVKKRTQGTAIANFGGFDLRTNFGRPAYANVVRGAPGYDVSDDEWHHVACVAPENATFSSVVLYKDGIVVPHHDDYGTDPLGYSGEGPLYIGDSGNAPGSSNNGPINGSIDDVRLYDKALTAEEIAGVMRFNVDLAWGPGPAHDASFEVDVVDALEWQPGQNSVSYQVYFGTDEAAVMAADNGDVTGIYLGSVDANTLPVPSLDFGQTLYWRVDSVLADGAIRQGELWRFMINGTLGLDNFNGYSDSEGEEIWRVWVSGYDGLSTNRTGSMAGHLNPPYAEDVIKKSGSSLPFYYDNTGHFVDTDGQSLPQGTYYAETSRTFEDPQKRNWTRAGVTHLSLSVRGQVVSDDNGVTDGTNGSDDLYIEVTDGSGMSAKVWHPDNPNAVHNVTFEAWVIDLNADIAAQGVDLTDIHALTIGVGRPARTEPAGKGLVYIENIQLTKP